MTRVAVIYHAEGGSWWADSKDVSGFTAVGETFAEVKGLVREGIPFYLDVEGIQIDEYLEDGARVVSPAYSWTWSSPSEWRTPIAIESSRFAYSNPPAAMPSLASAP